MKNYFEYKGYIGRVEMSEEDGLFCGTISGINDLVTFEADNFRELKLSFEEAVDDYLVFCEECGKVPEKMYRGQFNVRISPELHRDLAIESFKQNVSLNQIVEKACDYYVKNKKHNMEGGFSFANLQNLRNGAGWKSAIKNNFNSSLIYGGAQ